MVRDQLLKDGFQVEFLLAHRLKLTNVFQNVDFLRQVQVPPFRDLRLLLPGISLYQGDGSEALSPTGLLWDIGPAGFIFPTSQA